MKTKTKYDSHKTNKQKKKIKNNSKKDKYIVSTFVILSLFIIMLIVFGINIFLKLESNKLNSNLEEYQLIKEEIDYLTEIKEKYEILVKNNEELEKQKMNLENKIIELNNKINNLNIKIDKLK